jgi:hypothetical protein
MELQDALTQIADIRLQMARTRMFRGYRSSTTLFSAAVAIATALLQSAIIPSPSHHVGIYLLLWLTAAALCITVIGARIFIRYRQDESSLERELTILAIEGFIPSIIVGGLLTFVLARVAWSTLWILPGLWTILFGLGLLASRRILPRHMIYIGVFYLICGLLSIVHAQLIAPFSPIEMGLPFALGQSAAAAVLYFNLERANAAQ